MLIDFFIVKISVPQILCVYDKKNLETCQIVVSFDLRNGTLFDTKTLEPLSTFEWWGSIMLLMNYINQNEFYIIQLL